MPSPARALWQVGLDYDHGTGHGVGSYLSVHEGPVSLSRLARPVPIAAGMILSNEPGYYLPGAYGIRLENLLLVQPPRCRGPAKPFLRFETLTLAPFDRAADRSGAARRRRNRVARTPTTHGCWRRSDRSSIRPVRDWLAPPARPVA